MNTFGGTLVVVGMLATAAPLVLADDCLLNEKYVAELGESLAAGHTEAHFDPVSRYVRWMSPTLGAVSTRAIGCESLGLEVQGERSVTRRPSPQDAIAYAAQLVRVAWPISYARNVSEALLQRTATTREQDGQFDYEFDLPGYTVLVVTHSFTSGIERISVSAVVAM
jgi:hypothetical protein